MNRQFQGSLIGVVNLIEVDYLRIDMSSAEMQKKIDEFTRNNMALDEINENKVNGLVPLNHGFMETPIQIRKTREAQPGVEADIVEHPAHYNFSKLEVIDVIEEWKLGFHAGNVVKYVARSQYKGSQLQDLKKARWYLSRLISLLEKK